jgi:hypothetical protein
MKYRIYGDGDGDWSGIPRVLDTDPARVADELAAWAANEILGSADYSRDDLIPTTVEWSDSYRDRPDAFVCVEGQNGTEYRYIYITSYQY